MAIVCTEAECPSDLKNEFDNTFRKVIKNQIKLQKDLPKRQCKFIQNATVWIRLLVNICWITKFARKNSILIGFKF